MTPPPKNKKAAKAPTVEQQIRRRTLISFSVFFFSLTIGGVLFYKLYNQPQSADNVQPVLRKGLNANERIFSRLFSQKRNARSFKKKDAVAQVRVNGGVGMDGFQLCPVEALLLVQDRYIFLLQIR